MAKTNKHNAAARIRRRIIGSRYPLTNCKKGHIQIGCHCLTFKEWKTKGMALARANNFTKEEIEEYRAYIKLFMAIGK